MRKTRQYITLTGGIGTTPQDEVQKDLSIMYMTGNNTEHRSWISSANDRKSANITARSRAGKQKRVYIQRRAEFLPAEDALLDRACDEVSGGSKGKAKLESEDRVSTLHANKDGSLTYPTSPPYGALPAVSAMGPTNHVWLIPVTMPATPQQKAKMAAMPGGSLSGWS